MQCGSCGAQLEGRFCGECGVDSRLESPEMAPPLVTAGRVPLPDEVSDGDGTSPGVRPGGPAPGMETPSTNGSRVMTRWVLVRAALFAAAPIGVMFVVLYVILSDLVPETPPALSTGALMVMSFGGTLRVVSGGSSGGGSGFLFAMAVSVPVIVAIGQHSLHRRSAVSEGGAVRYLASYNTRYTYPFSVSATVVFSAESPPTVHKSSSTRHCDEPGQCSGGDLEPTCRGVRHKAFVTCAWLDQ